MKYHSNNNPQLLLSICTHHFPVGGFQFAYEDVSKLQSQAVVKFSQCF